MISTIIGWYGTETMGDIAILDGILSVLSKKGIDTVYLGSLFPFYTERTLLLEKERFSSTAPSVTINLFDIKDPKECFSVIQKTDCLIFGGGPLMDIEELYLMKECFKLAKKRSKQTFVFGCGIGPLFNSRYIKLVEEIFLNSDKISLRDMESLKIARTYFPKSICDKIVCLGDPAIISIEQYYKNTKINQTEDCVCINLREYPERIYQHKSILKKDDIVKMIDKVSQRVETVFLVPMLDFAPGCDDRRYLTELDLAIKKDTVKVLHDPLSLSDLYKLYSSAMGCIGMRHHSVVMQTILCGNNLIIDYTEPNTGKTQGFIKSLCAETFYNDRTVYLQTDSNPDLDRFVDKLFIGEKYKYQLSSIEDDYLAWFM